MNTMGLILMVAQIKGKFSTSQDALIEIDGHIPFLRQKIHEFSFFPKPRPAIRISPNITVYPPTSVGRKIRHRGKVKIVPF